MKIYVEDDYKHFSRQGKTYPCIILFTDNWDDYSYKTTFNVAYFPESTKREDFGITKIVCKLLSNEKDGKYTDDWTRNYLENEFENLDENFISLGQDISFYKNIKQYLDEEQIKEVLSALRDCGFDRTLLKGFRHSAISSSLFRSLRASEVLNQVRYILYSDKQQFKLNFIFSPKYNPNQDVTIAFNFDSINHKYFPNRIIAILGENGVGKTQIINALPTFIQNTDTMFNLIIHISNSYYDKGIIHHEFQHPEYKYYGIIKTINVTEKVNDVEKVIEKQTVLSKEDQIENIKEFIKNIVDRYEDYEEKESILKSFGDIQTLFPRINFEEIINYLQPEKKEDSLKIPTFIEDFTNLSSGESILIYNLINILSNIQVNSIFLLDEPEIHLHPNFITSYMEFLYTILERFDSFALIATHSTFVIREIKADCVYVVTRNSENFCEVNLVKKQTFGTNAMTLANNIFDNDLIQPYFIKQIKKYIYREQPSEEDIYNFFEYDEYHKLDLGIKMKIHSLYEELHD